MGVHSECFMRVVWLVCVCVQVQRRKFAPDLVDDCVIEYNARVGARGRVVENKFFFFNMENRFLMVGA